MFDAGNSVFVTGGSYAMTNSMLRLENDHSVLKVIKRLFSSVPFVTYLILMILASFGISIPKQPLEFLSPIASANAFLSMFMIGLMLEFVLPKEDIMLAIRAVVTRFVFALIFSSVLYFVLPLDEEIKKALTMIAFAPASALCPVFTEKAGGDPVLSSFTNSVTVMISIVMMVVLLSVF